MLLGDEQYETIHEAVRDEDGTVDIDGSVHISVFSKMKD